MPNPSRLLRKRAEPSPASVAVFGNGALRPEELLGMYEHARGDVTAICSSSGLIGYVSPACRATLGWDAAELVGRSIADFVHTEDLPGVRAACRTALQSNITCIATYRFRCRDGGYLWTESVLHQVPNRRHHDMPFLVASIRDVADRKLMEVRLQRQALTDPLTGIANRTVLMDRLLQAIRRLERIDTVLAVIYLDLDRFKVINDSLGHETGDRLLMKVAERALACIRPPDTLARIGGDEFVILAEGLNSASEARQLAARVCESMEVPFVLDGESIVCTTSAGVATTTDHRHSAQGLLQEADLALYRAKDGGRNRAEVFDEELRTTAIGRLAVEQTIRSAIDEDRLRVQYQPIVDLSTGDVCRAEALVRLAIGDALVQPDRFIEVAEETGLLVTIDEQVMSRSLHQVSNWKAALCPDGPFLGVALNVGGRQLADSRFAQQIEHTLRANGLDPAALSIEVTERVLMEASNSALDCLRMIRGLGVHVGLDDFGTGYSSLAYLRQFPVDFLKIDPTFVGRLAPTGAGETAIVTAIIELAHALGLSVTAEGVETEQQRAILTDLGCDHAQGFLFSPAVEPCLVATFLESRSEWAAN